MNVKMMILPLFALMAATAAHADGFRCQTTDGALALKMYNNTDPTVGTRTVAVMVLSDGTADAGSRTIARFTDVNETVSNSGASYVAKVDLRFNGIGEHQNAQVDDTTLGQLKTIHASVDFSYSEPVARGATISGKLVLVKRDGGELERDLDCTRYLKGN
jgi:hypothetical protein